MANEPLTDREWWLICLVQEKTLQAVIDGCARSGVPGHAVAKVMLDNIKEQAVTGELRELRAAAQDLLDGYKPDD